MKKKLIKNVWEVEISAHASVKKNLMDDTVVKDEGEYVDR